MVKEKIAPEVSDKFTLDNAADAIAHLQNRKSKRKSNNNYINYVFNKS